MAAMNANARQKLAIRRSDEEVLLGRVGVLSRGICYGCVYIVDCYDGCVDVALPWWPEEPRVNTRITSVFR